MDPVTTSTENTVLEETTPHLPVLQQLGILALILLLILGSSLLPELPNTKELQAETVAATVAAPAAVVQTETENSVPFSGTSIQAEAAFVWDVQTQKVLYQKNPDEQLPLASITKLMTALVAHELIKNDKSVTIDELSLKQSGNSGFLEGESFSLKNLLDLTLMSSSNDGAFAIAAAAGAILDPNNAPTSFVDAMNIRAKEIGLKQTFFRNPTGLDISVNEGGAYGSARDVTFLMEYILSHYPEILESTQIDEASIRSQGGAVHTIENTNPTINQIEGLIGSKTGYTDLAGGNLTIAYDAALNRPIIVVVLGSTRSGRFTDVLTLSEQARLAVEK